MGLSTERVATWLPGPLRPLYLRFEHLVDEVAKFGTVGAIAAVIDIGTFNLLRLGPLDHKVLTSKAISTVIAATFAYFANRYWTWRERGGRGLAREYVLFFVFNAVGLAIAEACLGFSHYILDLRHPLADNISANGFGLVLGTIFRFWAYRRWVFPEVRDPDEDQQAPTATEVSAPAP